ncbi:MAG: hypothetical protein JSV53_07375 [candidate division WOR-3 bacterium]|nr:MAG: hypothetical protein JSV53_07375 [candidate division WOR-3 bacterium]
MSSEGYLRRYLDAKEIVYEDICVQMGSAYWNYYSQEDEADLATPRERFRELLTNDTLNRIVDTWYARKMMIRDPILKSRVTVWHNVLTAAKVEMDPEIFALRNKLELWFAETDEVSSVPSREEMDSVMLRLMELRNARSKSLGFDNFAELVLEVSGIGADWFYEFVKTIDAATAEPYARLLEQLKQELGKSEIEANDIGKLFGLYYITNQGASIAEDKIDFLIKETIEGIGIEHDDLSVEIVEQDLPGGVGGQSLAIRIPENFKVVVRDELSFFDRVHELGHGAQYTFTAIGYPILEGYEWCLGSDCGAYSEGIAETLAKFARNEEWQKRNTGMSEEELMTQKEILKKYMPLYLRYLLVESMYEIALYDDLARDNLEIWQMLHKKYLSLEGSTARPIPFANIIHVSYPVYVQNYLIADVISWQIHEALEDRFGSGYAFDNRVGSFLKEYFYADGGMYPWQVRMERATGRELDLGGYLSAGGLSAKE